MGNVASSENGSGNHRAFAIEYIARYVSITKQQLIDLRNRCYMDMDNGRKIDRRSFRNNVELCSIQENPDSEILDCLFTMWDIHGESRILCPPFILSLAPLVCQDESFQSMLKFALDIFKTETRGILTADRLVFILKHMNQTASYFGDSPVTLRQIYKIVDEVFGTMSIVSQEGPTLTHEEVLEALSKSSLVRNVLAGDQKKHVSFSPVYRVKHEDGSVISTDTSSIPLTPIAQVRLNKIGESSEESDGTGSDVSFSLSPLRKAWMSRRNMGGRVRKN